MKGIYEFPEENLNDRLVRIKEQKSKLQELMKKGTSFRYDSDGSIIIGEQIHLILESTIIEVKE